MSLHLSQRFFSTANTLSKANSTFNQFRILGKMMKGKSKGKKGWFQPAPPTIKDFELPGESSKKPKVGNSRRSVVLNKLFMKSITDIMASGEVSDELIGKGIQISRVQIAPDFTHLSVYWIAKGTPQEDQHLESLLKRSAGAIQHILSSRNTLGLIPFITFVRDTHFGKYAEVEELLAKADFGEEYEPRGIVRDQIMLQTNLPSNVMEKIKKIEDSETIEVDKEEDLLPPMTQSVFGLDRAAIMNRIMTDVSKSKAAWIRYERGETIPQGEMAPPAGGDRVMPASLTNEEMLQHFADYLAKERVKEKKRKRDRMEEEQWADNFDLYTDELENKYDLLDDYVEEEDPK